MRAARRPSWRASTIGVALIFASTRMARADEAASNEELSPAQPTPFPGDYTWAPGWGRTKTSPLSTEYFTGEFRIDDAFHYSFARPKDDTIGGSSEVFRHGENQVTHLGFGGDFHVGHVHARLMTQFGLYSTATVRNDPSPSRGQWQLADAYRYLSEAYAGYRIDVSATSWINVQAGIFMSYVGLWSYYHADNWTFQPSYVSSNTPWFFNGVRVQYFPTPHLKIEPWIVNGWQAYGELNRAPGLGLQVRWNPTDWISVLGNQYYGADTLGVADRARFHTDDSIMVRYYDDPGGAFSKAAVSLTVDAGCERGGGVDCARQYFVGFMAYGRFWFHHDVFGLTLGGGAITNPGRYLVLLPPINGATATSGTPYFTTNPGDAYKAWDVQVTTDWMPSQFLTFRVEYDHRHANVPYFTGHDGITPPGGNQGAAGSSVPGWSPDLVRDENRVTAAMLLKI